MKPADTLPTILPNRRKRRHSAEFKKQVVKACSVPGVSIAGVALACGLNANLVRRWLVDHGVTPKRRRTASGAAQTPEFVPVTVDPPRAVATPEIRIELRRGTATVTVHWPVQAADDCAAWLREWLR